MLTYTVDSSFGYLWSGIRVEVYIVFMRNSSLIQKKIPCERALYWGGERC